MDINSATLTTACVSRSPFGADVLRTYSCRWTLPGKGLSYSKTVPNNLMINRRRIRGGGTLDAKGYGLVFRRLVPFNTLSGTESPISHTSCLEMSVEKGVSYVRGRHLHQLVSPLIVVWSVRARDYGSRAPIPNAISTACGSYGCLRTYRWHDGRRSCSFANLLQLGCVKTSAAIAQGQMKPDKSSMLCLRVGVMLGHGHL